MMFQSLTGRLQTEWDTERVDQTFSFNPSQVGYKPMQTKKRKIDNLSFNPSQVGYKRYVTKQQLRLVTCFNPSQVGYKHQQLTICLSELKFQSLTGRLQTGIIQVEWGRK